MLNLLCDFASVMKTIGYVLLAFVVLMVMVLIHETGHYTAGKLLGFQINEFAIGMGPKILSKKKKNGEVFSLRLLPLGGFCAFEGENDEVENPKAFNRQKPWKRLIVLFSGAFFNFVSAILIAIIVFSAYGETVVVVNNVYEYAPEANYQQIQSGDVIYKVNGRRVYILDSLSRYFTDDEMTLTVLRPDCVDENGNTVYVEKTLTNITQGTFTTFTLTKVDGNFADANNRKLKVGDTVYKINDRLICQADDWDEGLNAVGDTFTLTVTDGEHYYTYEMAKSYFNSDIVAEPQAYTGIAMSIHYDKFKFGFGEVLIRVVPYCCEVGMLVLRTLGGLLTGAVGIESVGGPITTISMTTQIVSTGFANVLMLIVLISVNLAVFNLLPVPALDGCQMVFVIIEWIAGKPINRKVQSYINGIGLVVLIVLMLLIDILKL
ncbi:MAG: RIP metalloprotease RseP [Clostridiales bacterium]|nr:RIP metalloprotease RseP [Clostridiales bacterium]